MTSAAAPPASAPAAAGRPSAPRERQLVVWLFVLSAAILLIFQEGAVSGYDGQTTYEVIAALAERGTVAISSEFNTLPGPDGRHYSRYGFGLSLLGLVPYLAARPLAAATGHPDKILEAAVATVMPLTVAGLVAAGYLLARRLRAPVPDSLLVAAGTVFGTFVLPYGKEFFSEPLTALCLVLAIERCLARSWAASGLWFGAAVLVRAQSAVFGPVLALAAWWTGGLVPALRLTLGAIPGIAATLGYNLARFGHPLSFGYDDVGFTTPLLTGAWGLLAEPRKSLLLFAPIVVLLPFALARLWRRQPVAAALLTANLAITLLIVTTWFAWHGGWCWGPRLVLPGVVPALAALAPWLSTPARRRAAAALFAAGFAVSAAALLVPIQAQQLELAPRSQAELRAGHLMRTQPIASPYPLRQLQLLGPVMRYSIANRYAGVDDGRNYLRYVSLWQFGLSRVFGPRGLALAAALTAALALAAAFAAQRLRAAVRRLGDDRADRDAPVGPAG